MFNYPYVVLFIASFIYVCWTAPTKVVARAHYFRTNSHSLDPIIVLLVRLAKAPGQGQLTKSGQSTNSGRWRRCIVHPGQCTKQNACTALLASYSPFYMVVFVVTVSWYAFVSTCGQARYGHMRHQLQLLRKRRLGLPSVLAQDNPLLASLRKKLDVLLNVGSILLPNIILHPLPF